MVKGKLKIWLLAARPKTLWAGISPVLIGTALAIKDGKLHVYSAMLCLLGAITIQVGTNFANDYFDFVKGSDTQNRKGPTRVTQAGLTSTDTMKRAIVFTMALVVVISILLCQRAGWPVLVIGLLSIISGILYTGGPAPYGYRGLGDLFVFLFFGPVAVGGTFFVQTLELNPMVITASIAPGMLSTAILVVNNLRDIDEDRLSGKRTLAVIFGKRFVKTEYLSCIIIAAIIPFILVRHNQASWVTLLSSLILFRSFPVIKIVWGQNQGDRMNQALADTGKILFLYSATFSFTTLI